MERLTEYIEETPTVYGCGKNCKHDYKYCKYKKDDCPTLDDIIVKLAEYEDMEEQGRLIKLPCKFNSILYVVDKELKKIFEVKLQSIEVMNLGLAFNGVWNDGTDEATSFALNEEYFGDFVFLTEEEAQQALKKQKEVE